MKSCFKCDRRLPLSEFYRHPMMGDGHLNKCKECAKRDVRLDYERKRQDPEWLMAERERGREKHQRLGYNEKYRGRGSSAARTFRHRYPEKAKAHNAVARALRQGALTRSDVCTECGGPPPIHAHHPDYAKPLEVLWLCARCHGKAHRKEAA